jgi:hypothetical protein
MEGWMGVNLDYVEEIYEYYIFGTSSGEIRCIHLKQTTFLQTVVRL